MGCNSSILNIYSKVRRIAQHQDEFEALSFSELDIGRLYKVFRRVDNDDSGQIDLAEMLAHFDLERTPFTMRVFSMFDEDRSGMVDFREFVLSLWSYCTLSKAALTVFAFDLYDIDSSGFISATEIKDMLVDIYGTRFKQNVHAREIEKLLTQMEMDGDPIDAEGFAEFSRTHPALLFNAFEMQSTIQKNVLGKTFWEFYSQRRIQLCSGRVFIPVDQFLEIHLNKKLKEQIAKGVVAKVKPNVLKVIKATGSHANRGGRAPDLNKELASKKKNDDEQDGSPSSASKIKPKLKATALATSLTGAEGGGASAGSSSNRRTKNASIHESGVKSEPRRRSFDGKIKAPMPLTYKTSSSDGTNAGANPEVLAIMMGMENKNGGDSKEAEAEAKKKAFFQLPRSDKKRGEDESTKREEAEVKIAQANEKQRRRSTFTHS